MMSGILLVAVAVFAGQTPVPTRPSPTVSAVRKDQNPTVVHALEVVDSLLAHPVPRKALRAADAGVAEEQTAWFKSLRDRLTTLLSMVQTPSQRVALPAPVDDKNIKALQEEATAEAVKFTAISNVLKTRHDVAMNAIRNMK
jgi:hypothetical protein